MYLYIVYEECHGYVSYWTTKAAAIKEVKKIIISGWPHSEVVAAQEEYEAQGKPNDWHEAFDDVASYHKVKLNKSWR